MKIIKILLLLLVVSSTVQAQETEFKNKGKFYAYWGWNRSAYTQSDIHFKGPDYDFTLTDVVAKDRQTPFSFNKYINPANITIPQTNYGIGYFFNEHYSVFVGVDHMKYVTVQNQYMTIDGTIGSSYPTYQGTYNGDVIQETDDFLKFEHTDGLNYIHVSLNRFDDISSNFGIHSENFVINLTEGIGAGILMPRTNVTLLGKERHDDFHVSGYGISAQMGFNFVIYKYFFIQTDVRGGYINMPDIRTTYDKADSASQDFIYMQAAVMLGGRFKLF
ncbi:hypothetical protein [Wenyingzhuangia marina]|uniref:Outer membrane protein beta-barrel domain-containing protein n=1 Tax=Wenyingzhuangia marina TaxID=1195760 RepID=A0A1M5UEK9_9FLAO|nr:hypothetical protein [Wenyingzhuangia marina]GGF68191.1 membrane protein [Wenyingzhuangia marina]SHH61370.1 hypothetical protein SAMN05444281_1206 [Wenyingzhuangia marina]